MPSSPARGQLLPQLTVMLRDKNADAMPDAMETSRRYRNEHAFRRDAETMASRGWRVEQARFIPKSRHISNLWLRKPRVVEVHYLR